jgi:hypothetical protein
VIFDIGHDDLRGTCRHEPRRALMPAAREGDGRGQLASAKPCAFCVSWHGFNG